MKKEVSGVLGGGIAIVFLVIFFAVPLVSVEKSYTEEEPYETTETYWDTEQYQEDVPIDYNVLEDVIVEKTSWSLGVYMEARVKIRNTDTEGGNFDVNFQFKDVYGVQKEETKTEFIASGQTRTVKCTYDHEMGDDVLWRWGVNEPYKTVTKTQEVEKERTVTKVKTVTKTKTVEKTLFEYIT